MSTQYIHIFDTTLRDGQQCPGAGMPFEKNIEYARLVSKAGLDILEAGFPAASASEFMLVKTIAEEASQNDERMIVTGLCQLKLPQIESTMKALQPALKRKKARVHTYLPVDPELMKASLGKKSEDKPGLLKEVYELIKLAADAGFEVEFSPEGYSKLGGNFDFTTDLISAAVDAGARIINCPDTIGGACRWQGKEYFVEKMNRHAKLIQEKHSDQDIIWSAHCHNDFGLALENTMNAVFMGPALQIEGCFNGVGERAGNAPLEQCIAYIHYFGKLHPHFKIATHFKMDKLQEISDFVSRYMLPRQPHWPITGENAAKHTSGGHVNAIIRNPLAYQPFNPSDVGNEISFIFGPSSGGNHAKAVIEKYGYECPNEDKAEAAQFIKDHYADRRKGITDQELLQCYLEYRKPIKITDVEYSKSQDKSVLILKGQFFDASMPLEISKVSADSALGALHQEICQFMPGIKIESYQSRASSKGIDAISACKIVIKNVQDQLFTGNGEDQDIEISALKALIDAVNQAYIHQFYLKKGD
jgi:2-isopropylmalate synthase